MFSQKLPSVQSLAKLRHQLLVSPVCRHTQLICLANSIRTGISILILLNLLKDFVPFKSM